MNARDLLDELGARVAAVWGETARWDLETRTGLVPELVAARDRVGPEAWAATVATFTAGPKPRAIAQGLLALLRRQAAAVPRAREVAVTSFMPTAPAPAPGLTQYQRRLLALFGPCPPPGKMQ